MTDMSNKLNIGNVHNTYTHSIKKDENKTALSNESPNENTNPTEVLASDAYGRILVKQADKCENADMIKSVKDSIEFYVKNPKLAAIAVKASDDAFDILSADEEASNAYEEACVNILDAAYDQA